MLFVATAPSVSFFTTLSARAGRGAALVLLGAALLLPARLTAATGSKGDAHKVRAATEAAAAVASVEQHKALKLVLPLVVDPAALVAAEQLRVDRYATTQRLSAELARHLDVAGDPCSRERIEQAIGGLLAVDTPTGFLPATADITTLQELATRHTWGLQRELTGWLTDASFERYRALLDAWDVR